MFIAAIWFCPEPCRDSAADVQEYNNNNGTTHILQLQGKVKQHLGLTEKICSIDEEEMKRTYRGVGTKRKREQVSERQQLSQVAIKFLDKPNVHRLLELVSHSVPMVRHISMVGELSLERAHQPLKRAISRSIMKHAHLYGMQAVIESTG